MIDNGPGRRRFSYDQALGIMREFNAGGVTPLELAERYNVDATVIRSMVTGRTYHDIWLTAQREQQPILDWRDPPAAKNPGPKNTPRAALADLIDLLKAHPGRWAWVKTVSKRPNLSWWHQRGLDAQMRKIDGSWRVYARWPEEDPLPS